MMFLEPELVIKRVSIVAGVIIIAVTAGATVWYNSNLKNEFDENYTETNNLRQETSRLGAINDELKNTLESNTKDLKNNIFSNKEETKRVGEETKRVDSEVKQQNLTLKQFQQEYEKFKTETRNENAKLKEANSVLAEQLMIKEILLKNEIKARETEHEKLKTELKNETARLKNENNSLNDKLRNKDIELQELRIKLNKEIEWREKNMWNR